MLDQLHSGPHRLQEKRATVDLSFHLPDLGVSFPFLLPAAQQDLCHRLHDKLFIPEIKKGEDKRDSGNKR
jgi:hypothetical protein